MSRPPGRHSLRGFAGESPTSWVGGGGGREFVNLMSELILLRMPRRPAGSYRSGAWVINGYDGLGWKTDIRLNLSIVSSILIDYVGF